MRRSGRREKTPRQQQHSSRDVEWHCYSNERQCYSKERHCCSKERQCYSKERQCYSKEKQCYSKEKQCYSNERQCYSKEKQWSHTERRWEGNVSHSGKQWNKPGAGSGPAASSANDQVETVSSVTCQSVAAASAAAHPVSH